MAILIRVKCSNHQALDGGFGREATVDVDTLDESTRDEVVQALVVKGWVIQFNGDHMDTYCSKKCAE